MPLEVEPSRATSNAPALTTLRGIDERIRMLTTPRLIAIALCAALNFAVGSIVYLIKLPLYLDSIGTILCALLIFPDRRAAFVCSFLAAMISTVITTLFINPFLIWFSATELALALVAAYFIADGEAIFRA